MTNDAEWVGRNLVATGQLENGRRLLYYDSDDQLDEILVKGGLFAGFSRPTVESNDPGGARMPDEAKKHARS